MRFKTTEERDALRGEKVSSLCFSVFLSLSVCLSLFLSLSREDFDEREPPQKREELSTRVLRAKKKGSFFKKTEKKKEKEPLLREKRDVRVESSVL